MQNKQIILDYIADLLEKDKQLSNFDGSHLPICKTDVLKDIIKKFNLKHSTAYLYCSYFDFKRYG
jgi:DNA primase large subunit|tara:strand:+ start:481 stop:675 length:195 start_codon:yes stop_codon:yes gene_type:complete